MIPRRKEGTKGNSNPFFDIGNVRVKPSKPQKDPDPQWQGGLDLCCFSLFFAKHPLCLYVEAPFHPDGREVASGNKKLGLSSAVEWGLKDLLLSGG